MNIRIRFPRLDLFFSFQASSFVTHLSNSTNLKENPTMLRRAKAVKQEKKILYYKSNISQLGYISLIRY